MGTTCSNYMNTNLIGQRIKINDTKQIGKIRSVYYDYAANERYTIQVKNKLIHIDMKKFILLPICKFWWYKIKMYFKKGKNDAQN